MNRKRRIEITIENRLLVIRRFPLPAVWCPECSATTLMITPEEAATLVGVSTRTIYAQVESGQFHFVETTAGKLMVCPNSLPTSTSTS